jgi:ATP-binding protein involved in chromosome partitioning
MKTYAQLKGDGGSKIIEQVSLFKAQIKNNCKGIKHQIAIASGKGGVGKSTITMQLAYALAKRDQRVAVFDADFNGPSLARLSGVGLQPVIPGKTGLVMPKTKTGIGVVSMGTTLPEGTPLDFIDVSGSESQVWRATKEFATFTEILKSVEWGDLDFLLFDLPPGAERTFQFAEFLGPQVNFILVTHSSELSQGVVARAITKLQRKGTRILGYIENMKGYHCPHCQTLQPLFPDEKSSSLTIPKLGEIPFDPGLATACDQGLDLSHLESSPAIQALNKIAVIICKGV